MTHDVIPIRVWTDGYGNPQTEELDTEKGFFEYNEQRTYNTDGELIRSEGILFLKADSQFDVTDTEDGKEISWRFTDVKNDRTFAGEQPQIIDDPRTGETHHFEILLR